MAKALLSHRTPLFGREASRAEVVKLGSNATCNSTSDSELTAETSVLRRASSSSLFTDKTCG